MGLLEDLIGQMATGAQGNRREPPAQASAGGPSMSSILIALAPIVLAMLNNRARSSPAQPAPAGRGGGLGDLLGQILGGGRGSSGMGGLGDLLEQFQRAGFGEQAGSWVGTGQNQPLPPNALEQVFGHKDLAEIARRAGLSEEDTQRGLSQLLPEMVDRVTPGGELPDGSALTASVDDKNVPISGSARHPVTRDRGTPTARAEPRRAPLPEGDRDRVGTDRCPRRGSDQPECRYLA